MCGICGIASSRGAVDPERLRRMSTTLYHRGPDSEGSHVDGPVGIAARRLAIIDLAAGDQPITNEDGSVVVVQNGEIYNYRELMHELERAGHTFRTRCDTEVLVHGYEQWGAKLWERLRGMFAVAVWDARERRLVLARDRFGIKPLAYRDVGGELTFSSELDALEHGDVDLDALEAFLTFNVVPGPLSIFEDIRKLLPGHLLTWQDGCIGPAIAYDVSHGSQLVRSLEVWLENDRSTQRTARSLHVHPHTLAYRLRRIEQLIGRDLSRTQDTVDVWLALRARRLLEREAVSMAAMRTRASRGHRPAAPMMPTLSAHGSRGRSD